ncbi:hypothetical protein M0R04_14685 [Candidatus Dojkabacteria bacterium]|jgi:hypothetical protein|nr:hypothetical protein [Candidatus Dojkabacteria bacterium]
MTKEFCLSNRRLDHEDSYPAPHYLEADVKEFIRLLKEEIEDFRHDDCYAWEYLFIKINELAGEKLI